MKIITSCAKTMKVPSPEVCFVIIGKMGHGYNIQTSKQPFWHRIDNLVPRCSAQALPSVINLHLPFHAGQRKETRSLADRLFKAGLLSNPSSSLASAASNFLCL